MSKLDVAVRGPREILVSRMFDASPNLLFRAVTDPLLLRRWLKGPDGWSLDQCEFDPFAGGFYCYRWRHEDGRSMRLWGSIKEFVQPHRIVHTGLFDDQPPSSETITETDIVQVGSHSRMETLIRFATGDARECALESNFAAGTAASYAWLDALLRDQPKHDTP